MASPIAGKSVTARQAIRALAPTCRVLVMQACGGPLSLAQAIADERDRFRRLEVCAGLVFADFPFLQHVGENIRFLTWQVSGPTQKLADEGKLEYLPLRISQVPRTFGRGGPFEVDAAIIQVSPPDANGYVSLGVSPGSIIDVTRGAPIVIAEVNRQAPRALGNASIHVSQITYLVDADYPIVQHRKSVIGDVERKIAEHVADLVPDGATIQTGIGAVPEALMFLLDAKKDLGVHSGMISDGYIPLIEKGVINNRRKSIDRHKIVLSELMGGPELFRFAHDNPLLHFDSVSYVHNAHVVSQHESFVSINSAVEIDLGGQVAAESIGPRQISGLGGQFDFVEGVLHSKGGVSIFALPATASRGKVSRIVAQLAPGAVVSTPRYLTDVVVTEYGVARLKGKTMRQRAEALIAIAHPDFRDGLSNGLR